MKQRDELTGNVKEVKVTLEESERKSKRVQDKLEATIAEQKEETAKEIIDVKAMIEKSQELVKTVKEELFIKVTNIDNIL